MKDGRVEEEVEAVVSMTDAIGTASALAGIFTPSTTAPGAADVIPGVLLRVGEGGVEEALPRFFGDVDGDVVSFWNWDGGVEGRCDCCD